MKLCFVLSVVILLTAPSFAQLLSPKQPINKKYYLITWNPVNWFMAFSHCRSMDMNLVSITSKEENDRIIKQIRDEGHEDKDFWTSGTKLGNDDDYQWLSIGKPVKFTDWGHGQPSNSSRENQNESCIHICRVTRGSRVALKWNDHLCSAKLYFICEQDLIEYEYCAS